MLSLVIKINTTFPLAVPSQGGRGHDSVMLSRFTISHSFVFDIYFLSAAKKINVQHAYAAQCELLTLFPSEQDF